jgi:hypothetical protein
MRTISIAAGLVLTAGALASCSDSGSTGDGHGLAAGVRTTVVAGSASGGSARAGGSSAGKDGVCQLIGSDVARRAVGRLVTDVSVTANQCVFADAGGANRVELLQLPASTIGAQKAAGSFTPLTGVGDQAYWDSDDELLLVVKGDKAYSASVSGDAISNARSKAASISVVDAALNA